MNIYMVHRIINAYISNLAYEVRPQIWHWDNANGVISENRMTSFFSLFLLLKLNGGQFVYVVSISHHYFDLFVRLSFSSDASLLLIATFAWKMHEPFEKKIRCSRRKWVRMCIDTSTSQTLSLMNDGMNEHKWGRINWQLTHKIMYHLPHFISLILQTHKFIYNEWLQIFKMDMVNATRAIFIFIHAHRFPFFAFIQFYSCDTLDASQLQRVAFNWIIEKRQHNFLRQ